MSRSRKRTFKEVLKVLVIATLLVVTIVRLCVAIFDNEKRISSLAEEAETEEAEAENLRRLSTIEKVCKKYELGEYKRADGKSVFKHPPAPQYSVFYIERKHNISYCPIYKAGTTTWLYNLCLLMNVSEEELNSGKEQISTIARRVIPELEYPQAEEALRKTKKLLVVRHPFERLLSAYRDKLENSVAGREHGTLHFYRKYGAQIVRKYRDKNFVKPRSDQVIRRKGVPPPAGIEPTWREFVEYLINTDLASYGDDHWIPYYLYCTPCLVKYDIVAKVESLWRDQIYAIEKLGLKNEIIPRWRHSNGYSNATKIYFSQLNRNAVRKLYEKFKLDFELFDYSPEMYYEYATAVD